MPEKKISYLKWGANGSIFSSNLFPVIMSREIKNDEKTDKKKRKREPHRKSEIPYIPKDAKKHVQTKVLQARIF